MPGKQLPGVRTRICIGAIAACAAFGALACEPVQTSAYTELSDGVYCLASDIEDVELHLAGNTTLDCKGHKAWGVSAIDGDNIVVKNCVFGHSVFVLASNYRIVDNVFPEAPDRAIYANGMQGLVARNRIYNHAAPPIAWAGIETYGIADVIGNTVITTFPSGTQGVGILIGGAGGVVADNLVRMDSGPGSPGAAMERDPYSWPPQTVIYRNVLVTTPGSDLEGLNCSGNAAFQNLAVGFAHPYLNCAKPDVPVEMGLKPASLPRRHGHSQPR